MTMPCKPFLNEFNENLSMLIKIEALLILCTIVLIEIVPYEMWGLNLEHDFSAVKGLEMFLLYPECLEDIKESRSFRALFSPPT